MYACCFIVFYVDLGTFVDPNGVVNMRFNRPLSKLNFAFEITNSSNEIEAQGKAFASITVTFRHDAKAFKLPDDVVFLVVLQERFSSGQGKRPCLDQRVL